MNCLDLLITGCIGFLLGMVFGYKVITKAIRVSVFVSVSTKRSTTDEDAMKEAFNHINHIHTISSGRMKDKKWMKQFNQLERKVKKS